MTLSKPDKDRCKYLTRRLDFRKGAFGLRKDCCVVLEEVRSISLAKFRYVPRNEGYPIPAVFKLPRTAVHLIFGLLY